MSCQTDLPPEVSITEAADILNVSRKTVYKMISAGALRVRDAAPPGSRRARYRLLRDEVTERRTAYVNVGILPA